MFIKKALMLLFFLSNSIYANYVSLAHVTGDTILSRCEAAIAKAQEMRSQLQVQNTEALLLYNEILVTLSDPMSEAGLLSQVHPQENIRKDAEACEQIASRFMTDLSLDAQVFQAILKTDKARLDKEGLRMLEQTLLAFRRAGVDKSQEEQAKIKKLQEDLVSISQQFDQNINNDVFFIELEQAEDLDGLPQDYIISHKQASGKYIINTTYPDYVPFMKYAKNDAARRELRYKYLNRGQNNGVVLDAMIKKRHELAQLLGYKSYASYIVEDKMIKSSEAIHKFIDQISAIAKNGADHEFQELLSFKQRTSAHAGIINGHESSYLEDAYKKEKYAFDSQSVRPYFAYNNVRDGLLKVTAELFNIRYELVQDAHVWHESVVAYDVFDEKGQLGRIYLDMHPRKDKYSHAAQFTLRSGIADRKYPEGVLVCNFPNPREGDKNALMEHGDVVTFFHEFGHLLHHIFAGRQTWASFSGVATEWDFVEAPSQLLEEWAWAPEVLSLFARHYQTNEVIPLELVNKMRAAEEFGKAILARQQMFYAALSVNYYDLEPSSFDPINLMKDLQAKYSYYPYEDGTKFVYNFGHLNGYSAMYYTYMWSLSLAKDLFEPFKQGGHMNKDIFKRYRDLVLAPGGSKDAKVLVEQFLGRPFQFDAFERWLTSGA